MNKLIKFSFILIISINLFACSKTNVDSNKGLAPENPEYLFQIATIQLDKKKYDEAHESFKYINFQYPLSNEGIQSKIMIGFIEYLRMNYEDAIFKFDNFINLYPAHKDIDYVYYMKAICFYEQINNESLDGDYNIKALDGLNQIINRFPDSQYAVDSSQKIILLKENIAAKHMRIGLFYLNQKNYLASLNRYNLVITDFSQSKFTPEALYRLVEIYRTLGMNKEAKETSSVIAFNYPKSVWYLKAYNLISEDKKKEIKFKNIINFWKNDNQEE